MDTPEGFYVIYETDGWDGYSSMVIKAIVQGLGKATSLYWQIHSDYYANDPLSDWQLKMGFLSEDYEPSFEGNVLRELADCTPQPQSE